MRLQAPSPALAPFVRDLMIVEVGDEVRRLRLPEPGLVLAVRYRGFASVGEGEAEERLPEVALAGMAMRARSMRTSSGGGVALVRFRPGGAARFFEPPLHELFELSVPLGDVAPRGGVARLHERVGEAQSDAERVRLLEEFLRERERERTDPLVSVALQRIARARDGGGMRALARGLGLSLDAFEKRFRRAVGCTPKQFASLLRLQGAIDSYRPGTPLTQLALDAGYYDQAHFNRELRAVTGMAPGQFFRSAHAPSRLPLSTTRAGAMKSAAG